MKTKTEELIEGCYLHYRDISKTEMLYGVEKKVSSQIKALNNSGLICDFLFCEQPETFFSIVKSCLPFTSDCIHWPDPKFVAKYDFIYIRRPRFASKELMAFVKQVKEINPKTTIIYEIPTYPYDHEMSTLLQYPALMKDRSNRGELRRYIDKVTAITNIDEIFGIEVIPIINGIDLTLTKPKKPAESLTKVHILAVAYFTRTHGLDRFIDGLVQYYRNNTTPRDIVLHIAGIGEDHIIKRLRRQVKGAALNDHVVFHGYQTGEELELLYNQCSIAIEVLGFHRVGISTSSTLKSREYLAKGIPFICANDMDVFEDVSQDFCLKLPSNESPVDIEEMLHFHDNLYSRYTQEELIERIRAFAENHIGMEQALSSIVTYIKKEHTDE